ncbi:MAG: hypothetical protein J7L91_01210 [Candidatus Korarchaeota archaeon]|nr:hypothetical protein [Candidatus Korarchaeota archaeon]
MSRIEMTRLVVPIEESGEKVKSNRISRGFSLAKGLMVIDLSDFGVVTDAFSLELDRVEGDMMLDVLMGLDVDIVLSEDIEPELSELLLNNNVKIALTTSKYIKDALRDLLAGKVMIIPGKEMPIRYAN